MGDRCERCERVAAELSVEIVHFVMAITSAEVLF
jgi:hypothetical protein